MSLLLYHPIYISWETNSQTRSFSLWQFLLPLENLRLKKTTPTFGLVRVLFWYSRVSEIFWRALFPKLPLPTAKVIDSFVRQSAKGNFAASLTFFYKILLRFKLICRALQQNLVKLVWQWYIRCKVVETDVTFHLNESYAPKPEPQNNTFLIVTGQTQNLWIEVCKFAEFFFWCVGNPRYKLARSARSLV